MQSSTQLHTSESRSQSFSYIFFCFTSVLVWLITAIDIRLWGHRFFIPDSSLSIGSSFLFSLIVVPLLAYALFRWQQVQPDQRRDAAICLAVPAMLLDVVTTYFFTQVYPNLLPSASGAYGAWVLWSCALVLITGFVTGQKHKSKIA